MRTDVTTLDSNGANMQTALDTVEGLATIQKLSPRESLHLRLLAEEVLAMVRMVVDDFTARFWAIVSSGAFTCAKTNAVVCFSSRSLLNIHIRR